MMRIKTVLGLVAVMAAMLVVFAVPAMADDNKNNDNDWKWNKHDNKNDNDWNNNRWNNNDWNNNNWWNNNNNRFFDDDNFDFDFDNDLDQDADSGDVDQTFVVTNTGDNANQCAGIQGVANTGNAQNQIGINQIGSDGDNNNWWNNNNNNWWNNNNNWWNNGNGNGFNDFEFDDVGSTIEVNPTNTTRCDQQVNQAASAFGGW
jgi:hypothetical protein